MRTAERFCVNVLGDSHGPIALRFGSPVEDRFEGGQWVQSPNGSWVLPDAIAVPECRLWNTHEGGDHTIIVGEVSHMGCASEGNPLLFFRGEFRPIGPAIPN